MSKWIDVAPNDWFYKDVIEASNIKMEDGRDLISGIPYGGFEENAPYVYEEHVANGGQTEFIISSVIEPRPENPLYVYIDGTQTVFKSAELVEGGTKVTLYSSPRQGAIVSFASFGIPKVNNYGKPSYPSVPVQYPSYQLSKGSAYVYDRFASRVREYVYAFGRQLKRVDVSDTEWASASNNLQKLLSEKIGYENDLYCVSPSGVVYLPYNLNNVTCKMVYGYMQGYIIATSETFKPQSPSVLFTNRFFPYALITRAEAFTLINRLRITFYRRYTDSKPPSHIMEEEFVAYEGQVAFLTNGRYPAGEGELKVWKNGKLLTRNKDYIESSQYEVVLLKPLSEGDVIKYYWRKLKSDRLVDVGAKTRYYVVPEGRYIEVNGEVGNQNPEDDSWWAANVLDLEQEVLSDGTRMVSGRPVTNYSTTGGLKTVNVGSNLTELNGNQETEYWFMPESFMSRAEAVTILNKFRALCIERFI